MQPGESVRGINQSHTFTWRNPLVSMLVGTATKVTSDSTTQGNYGGGAALRRLSLFPLSAAVGTCSSGWLCSIFLVIKACLEVKVFLFWWINQGKRRETWFYGFYHRLVHCLSSCWEHCCSFETKVSPHYLGAARQVSIQLRIHTCFEGRCWAFKFWKHVKVMMISGYQEFFGWHSWLLHYPLGC